MVVVVVELWSSVVLAAWGLAMALIPDMTNNTQKTIIQVLVLFCSLFMISSCSAGLAVAVGSAPQGVWGTSRPVCGATIMTFRRVGVNRGFPLAVWGGHTSPPRLILTTWGVWGAKKTGNKTSP